MQHLEMQTPDITSLNIANIAKLFPNVITEKKDSRTGKTLQAIDFDMLKQELSSELVEDHEERYTLNWPGKKASLLKANTPISKTLRPCREDSVDFDTTENVYIEGDNFEVLKILQESYLGKVKMIYIDPPYNTGKDFVYKDNFKVSKDTYEEDLGVEDEEGGKLFKNTDTNGRFHSDWLSMMYERLTVARDLLKDDGVIFMSIDDNEVHNLRKIADEIFGEENLITSFIWNCSTAGGIRPKFTSKTHETILVYSKNIELLKPFNAPLSPDAVKQYNKKDEKGIYREKDFIFKNASTNINQKYLISCPDGSKVTPKEGYIYRFIRSTFDDALNNNMVVFKETNKGPLINQDGGQASWNIYIKKYLGDSTGCPSTLLPKDLISIYNVGTQLVQKVFDGKRVFENSKPIDLIKYLLGVGGEKDSIVLDFFSGSASTAHAVMQLNAEDGGNRKFICVQLQEETDDNSEAFKAGYKNICEIGKERIRRAGKKIVEENREELEKRETPLDTGFRVYKTDSSNMKDVFYHPSELEQSKLLDVVDNIKADRSSEDILTQVILDLGLTLDMPIEKKNILGNDVYFVAGNSLVACFDENIDFGIVDEIAKQEPLKVVFRDSCFKTDSDRINFENRFKKLSDETDIRVI